MNSKHAVGAVSLATLLFLILPLIVLRAPGNQPESAAYSELIALNRQRGRDMQALFAITALADQQGWTPDLLRLAGDTWRDAGDVTRALPYYEAAAVQLPDDPVLARSAAEAYLATQRWTQAADQLALLIELEPEDAWAHYHLGLLRVAYDPLGAAANLRVAGRVQAYEPVVNRLLRIVENQADDALIGMPVGLALAEAELWPYAEVAFQHAADVSQNYPEALAYVALARDRQGKAGGQWIEQAVALDGQNAVVRFIQGLHLRLEDDLEGSLNALVQAVALDPQNPAYYAELGTAYRLVGDLENAGRWLRVAVEVSNQDVQFQRLLALFYAEELPGLDEGSLSDFEIIATLMPDDPEVSAGMAWAAYRSGDVEAALAQLDTVLALVPDHPRSLYYKARIALEGEQWDEARRLLEHLLTLESPFEADAQRLLNNLGGAG